MKNLVSLSLILLSLAGSAQENNSQLENTDKTTAIKKESENKAGQESETTNNRRYTLNESAIAREGKRYQIVLSPHFANHGFRSDIGIGLYHFLSSDESIGLNYFHYSDDAPSLFDGFALDVGYKKYVGNSFYWQPIIVYRNMNVADSALVGSGVKFGSASFSDISAGIKIGNQWQWDNFTLGCDWIGLAYRMALLSENEDPADPSDILDDSSQLGTLLNFYLGWSF